MRSPFSRVLAIGYYDGPTLGWLMTDEGRVFPFEMIDEDEGHEARVFAVGPELLGDVHARVQAEIQRRSVRESVVRPGSEVGKLFDRSTPVSVNAIAVFASVDVTADIVQWVPVSGSSRCVDWMLFFGLPRSERA